MKPSRALQQLIERRLQPVRDALDQLSTYRERLPRLPVDALTRLVMLAVGLSLLTTYGLLRWLVRKPVRVAVAARSADASKPVVVEEEQTASKPVVHILWDVEVRELF